MKNLALKRWMRHSIKALCLMVYLMTSAVIVYAQPQPCNDPPRMTSLCQDACIICNIDGFKGRHAGNTPGKLPSDFCTTTVHNSQWIAFIAGSVNLSIQLTVSNCVTQSGLEMTVYFSRDCQNFRKVFNCDGDVRQGEAAIFKNTEPLVIGQYYYLTMDGNGGDNCDWTLKVLEGTTLVNPLDYSGNIIGPSRICPGIDIDYSVDVPKGATEFAWTVNNQAAGQNNSKLKYNFQNEGLYQICVTSSNVCDKAAPTCTTVQVAKPVPGFINDTICTNECVTYLDSLYCKTGNYLLHYKLPNGCDSLVYLTLVVQTPYVDTIGIVICEDDVLNYNGQQIDTTGFYSFSFAATNYCDSTLVLYVRKIICNIEGLIDIKNPSCNGFSDGQIRFYVRSGTPPFSYTFYSIVGDTLQKGVIPSLADTIEISDLRTGNYFVKIDDDFGNTEVLIIDMDEPDTLNQQLYAINYKGFNIDCHNSKTGEISVVGQGGTPPYNIYSQELGIVATTFSGLSSGLQHITITDAKGCQRVDTLTLTTPDSIQLAITFEPSSCEDNISGQILFTKVAGGVPGYEVSTDSANFKSLSNIENVAVGAHFGIVRDANNCERKFEGTIRGRQIPEVDLPEMIVLDLGDAYEVFPEVNDVKIDQFQWKPDDIAACSNCKNTTLLPVNTQWLSLSVTSSDQCTSSDSMRAVVIPKYKVFSPNIMLGDDESQAFHLEFGNDVMQLLTMQIYDRWGNLIFQSFDSSEWDGKVNGKVANEGVYAWLAQVEFINGEVRQMVGTVVVVR